MDWECKIEKVSNGFIINQDAGFYEEDEETRSKIVFQEIEEEKLSELKAFQSLVWHLMDYFAIPDSKHNKYRLNIEIVKQED